MEDYERLLTEFFSLLFSWIMYSVGTYLSSECSSVESDGNL
jgi:hypothetical protein